MNKFLRIALLAAVVMAVAALPAGAFSFKPGLNYGNVIDYGSDYWNSSTPGDRTTYTELPGGAGRTIPSEQRTIFELSELRAPEGDLSPNYYQKGQGGVELTGLMYDVIVVDAVAGPDNDGSGQPDNVTYYLAGAGSWENFPNGRMDMYIDSTTLFDPTDGGKANAPDSWVAVAAQPGVSVDPTAVADSFPTASDGTLIMSCTFLPIEQRMVGNTLYDIVMKQMFFEPVGGSGTGVFIGHSYMDFVYCSGYGTDLIVPTTWASGITSDFRFKANYDLPGPNGWTVKSQDPLDFNAIPEPATMVLLGASLLGLIPAIRRRRK